jgi:hypothetical protein
LVIVNEASAKIISVHENLSYQEPKGNCEGNGMTEENQHPVSKAPSVTINSCLFSFLRRFIVIINTKISRLS